MLIAERHPLHGRRGWRPPAPRGARVISADAAQRAMFRGWALLVDCVQGDGDRMDTGGPDIEQLFMRELKRHAGPHQPLGDTLTVALHAADERGVHPGLLAWALLLWQIATRGEHGVQPDGPAAARARTGRLLSDAVADMRPRVSDARQIALAEWCDRRSIPLDWPRL